MTNEAVQHDELNDAAQLIRDLRPDLWYMITFSPAPGDGYCIRLNNIESGKATMMSYGRHPTSPMLAAEAALEEYRKREAEAEQYAERARKIREGV